MTSTYSGLMSSLNAPEGSEMHDRLTKLQELEQIRKERENARRERRRQGGESHTVISRTRPKDLTTDVTSVPSYTSTRVRRGLSQSSEPEYDTYGGSSYRFDYGARPKVASHSGTEEEDVDEMFKNMTDSVLGIDSSSSRSSRRRPALGDFSSSYSSDRRRGYEKPNYTRSVSDNISESDLWVDPLATGPYSSSYSRRHGARTFARDDNIDNGQENENNEYITTEEVYDIPNTTESTEYIEEFEEGEEPKHFIERLKNGSPAHYKRGVGNDYILSSIPSIPPLKKHKHFQPDGVPDLVEPVDDILAVAKDIRATFGIVSPKSGDSQTSDKKFDFNSSRENLHGNSSSNGDFVFTAKNGEERPSRQSNNKRRTRRSLRGSRENLDNDKNNLHQYVSGNNENTNDSVVYEIIQAEDDSDDDEGKILISNAMNDSGWVPTNTTPGRLDEMHQYFNAGDPINYDNFVWKLHDGEMLKDDLEKSFPSSNENTPKRRSNLQSPEQQKGAVSSIKSAFNDLVKFDKKDNKKESSSSDSTPDKESVKDKSKPRRTSVNASQKATSGKGKKAPTPTVKKSGRHKAVEKVKAANKSSDSDNDSFQTASESESDYRGSKRTSGASTPTKTTTGSSKSDSKAPKQKQDMGMTLTDKLAKLETMTQEKRRRQSSTESENKKPLPSYMSGTSASQSKSRPKSPVGLAKDVRELKKFVHEHTSETSTPVHTSRKEAMNSTPVYTPRKGSMSGEQNIRKTVARREISTQTDMKLSDAVAHVYVCIHCGKSSDQRVEYAVSDVTTDGEDTESLDRFETRSETGYNLRSVSSKTPPKPGTQKWTFGKNEKRRSPTASKSYMKGTTSSNLKTSMTDISDKTRKASAPDVFYNNKFIEKASKAKVGSGSKSIVAQRAKELELAAKKGEQKRMAYAGHRPKSAERNRNINDVSNERSKLGKSKSVEEVYLMKSTPQQVVDIDIDKPESDLNDSATQNLPGNEDNNSTLGSPGEKRTRAQMMQQSPERQKQSFANSWTPEISKDDKSSTPKSSKPAVLPKPKRTVTDNQGPKSPIRDEVFETPKEETFASPKAGKPPVVAPKPKRKIENIKIPISPIKADEEGKTVESTGQFTRLENNPFIRNDPKRRNSLNEKKDGESVWEKSSVEGGSPHRDSSLKRSQSSAGEKSSLNSLNWSDSGSSESLHRLRSTRHRSSSSSMHGSFESLNRSPQRQRSSSVTSDTSQNAMLNLLSPIGTTRNPVTGALETDVDAAYVSADTNTKEDKVEHNEETVDRAHLEFAKQACGALEFDQKKRDSSSDSQKGTTQQTNNVLTNGHGSNVHVNGQENQASDKNAKKGKDKQKKGFFKGKVFKK